VTSLVMGFFQEESFQVSIFQCFILQFPHKQQMHPKTRVLRSIAIQTTQKHRTRKTTKSKNKQQEKEWQGGRYQWHWLPDFLPRGTNDCVIPPFILCLIRFCKRGKFRDIMTPPMMWHGRMVSRHKSLWKINVFMMSRRDTSVEGLYKY
jgi:hypothetical protein